jgi:hypothetical protein
LKARVSPPAGVSITRLRKYFGGLGTLITLTSGSLLLGETWALPIATTVAGTRGYIRDETVLPLVTGLKDLAAMIFADGEENDFDQRLEQSLRIGALQPTVVKLAEQMRQFVLFANAAKLR